jgi:hypothetical protein
VRSGFSGLWLVNCEVAASLFRKGFGVKTRRVLLISVRAAALRWDH